MLPWTMKLFSVFQIVPVMELLILNLRLVHAKQNGRERTARKVPEVPTDTFSPKTPIEQAYTKYVNVSELCDLDCGAHGHCLGDACVCNSGWSGEHCSEKQCDSRWVSGFRIWVYISLTPDYFHSLIV